MFKDDRHIDRLARAGQATARAGQAATELAVFGAILIFVLGTIVRTAVGNNYSQSQSFKAMRMAMLSSWNGSKAGSTSRNSASVLFVQDRLSPDIGKYGDLDRSPFIVNGSGTFTYELLYPMDPSEVNSMLPIMDVYINGEYFPFTTASYVQNRTIVKPLTCNYPTGSCAQNQCLRNQREWVGAGAAGGVVNQNEFESIVPVPLNANAGTAEATNANKIFQALSDNGLISGVNWSAAPPTATVNVSNASSWQGFIAWYKGQFPGKDQNGQISQIENLLEANKTEYKLFYSQAVNGTAQFIPGTDPPPTCVKHPCKDQELSKDLILEGQPNTNGDLMWDLQRLGVYPQTQSDASQNPSFVYDTTLRNYMAWQWSATAGTTADMIGLDPSNNQYPQYDVDGRLKTVTIYGISQDPATGAPIVSYQDSQGGDIDATWDSNSCGPKPGLQNDSQILTYTKAGTYLLMKDGKMYNPETNQFVRSANQRDTIDVIQRLIQLSNNTGRFCTVACTDGSMCGATIAGQCADGSLCTTTGTNNHVCNPNSLTDTGCAASNPVTVCVDSSGAKNTATNCTTSDNVAQTCFDANGNRLFVRSRVEDRRGRFWLTDTEGQLQVK